jgi:hypothetical protein
MTRRSPRTSGSHERPRAAGRRGDLEGPGDYRAAATMFVHFRETPYGLAMSLVETRRENGKVRHEHVASLGSIETPPSVVARIEFWRPCPASRRRAGWRAGPAARAIRHGNAGRATPLAVEDAKRGRDCGRPMWISRLC